MSKLVSTGPRLAQPAPQKKKEQTTPVSAYLQSFAHIPVLHMRKWLVDVTYPVQDFFACARMYSWGTIGWREIVVVCIMQLR